SAPYGLQIDPVRRQLFAADWGAAGRVLEYDITALSDGQPAVHVLGETGFNASNSSADTGGPTDNLSFGPEGVAYDPNNQRLFVEDLNSNRIMNFDLAGGITDGMSASSIIGQPDFSSSFYDTIQPSSADFGSLGGSSEAFDPVTNRLYASDDLYGRVLIF